ncbi:itaconate degradation transcriptional regulator RipR, partial [Staphylococcus aureus]|nr:itaconate degradation transcriptional regulator RipR [Staphylococcus aureus]
MELRHIRYFLAVAEERHFTRAATKLGIGQPPLSQQIKDLERELGAQLFRRVPHGAELTEAGKAFYDVVKGLPATATRAVLAAQRVARGESGVLRVGFTASAAFNSVVPGAIRTFKRAYPDVRLQLEEGNTTQLADELNEGSLDVAFLRPGFTGNERFQLRLLSEEPMVIVLAETHPAAACKQIAP